MSPKYLLDTNVVVAASGQRPDPNVEAWLDTVDDRDLAISVLTVQELWKGVGHAQKKGLDPDGKLKAQVEAIVAAYEGRILSLDPTAAASWGLHVGQQDKHVTDKGIAAIAAVNGCVLVTRNVKHMTGLGVDVLDPFKSPPTLHKAD